MPCRLFVPAPLLSVGGEHFGIASLGIEHRKERGVGAEVRAVLADVRVGAGARAELRDLVVGRDYPELTKADFSLDLVEVAPRLLSAFNPTLSSYARRQLERRGVLVHVATRVERVGDGVLSLPGGDELTCDLLIWAAGVAVPRGPAFLDVARTPSGRLAVTSALQLRDHPGVFAIGDVAAAAALSGRELPQLAQPAIQAGRHVARELIRTRRGLPLEPFAYRDRGTMATIGRRSAVAELPAGVRLTGTLAWLVWLTLHLVELLGGRNRVSVFLNWTWRYVSWPRAAGLISGPTTEE